MSDLVAIVAAPGASPVAEGELAELLTDYAALRGPEHPRSIAGNDRVQTAVLLSGSAVHTPPPRPTADPPSFVQSVGRIQPADSWVSPHERRLAAVDGQFALVSFDAATQQVLLANDPMGMQPLYVAERPGRIYASTSSLVLARHLQPSASVLGLQTFLVAGYHFGARTHWEGIERLDPATCLCVGADGIERRTYWRPHVDRTVAGATLEASADIALDVACSTFASYLGADEHWADLTGGFDSRLLCLLLDKAGVRFATNTRHDPSGKDREIARQVASRAGWEWFDAGLPRSWPVLLPELLHTALTWGDANREVLQLSRVLHPHQQMAAVRPRLLLGGGGEHFQYYGWQSEFFNAGRTSTFDLHRWIDMIGLKPVRRLDVLASDPRPAVREDYRIRLLSWVEPYREELNTTQLELLYAYKSTGHFGAYRAADLPVLETELPYYYKPVFSTAISMHHRHRNGHRLMRHMIARLDPHVAALDTTKGGPALPLSVRRAHRYLPYVGVLGRKGVNKISARLTGAPWLPISTSFPWEQAANGAVLAELQGTGILDWSQMRVGRLLDRDRFASFVESSLLEGFDATALLGRILTVEMALRETDTALA